MSTISTIYLVSGSNRGIGLGLVTQILCAHPDAFVYAGTRDPDNAPSLQALKDKYPERIAVVKCVSADVEGNQALAKEIANRHGRIDTVIANAGIGKSPTSVAAVETEVLDDHFKVNVTGTIVLFQAVYDLLKKSPTPRFVPISTSSACFDALTIKLPSGGIAYGASKAALNWATRKIHFENDWLVTFPLDPGPVNTDMFQYNVQTDPTGMFKKFLASHPDFAAKPDDAAARLMKIIDESTREKEGGQFVNIDGSRLDW